MQLLHKGVETATGIVALLAWLVVNVTFDR